MTPDLFDDDVDLVEGLEDLDVGELTRQAAAAQRSVAVPQSMRRVLADRVRERLRLAAARQQELF